MPSRTCIPCLASVQLTLVRRSPSKPYRTSRAEWSTRQVDSRSRSAIIRPCCVERNPSVPTHRPSTIHHRTALFEDAVAIVEEEYASDLSLDDIARRVASSRRQLQRAYAEIGDTTFREHLTRVRMDRAAALLRRPRPDRARGRPARRLPPAGAVREGVPPPPRRRPVGLPHAARPTGASTCRSPKPPSRRPGSLPPPPKWWTTVTPLACLPGCGASATLHTAPCCQSPSTSARCPGDAIQAATRLRGVDRFATPHASASPTCQRMPRRRARRA